MRERKGNAVDSQTDYNLDGLSAFAELRRESRARLDGYTSRLVGEAASSSGEFDLQTVPEENGPGGRWLVDGFKQALRRASLVYEIIKLIPSFVRQMRTLHAARANREVFGNVVVAIASGRLHSARAETAPREYLVSLVRSFPDDPEGPNLCAQLDSSRYVLVFEPILLSPLWKNKERCWRDGLLIVDVGFLWFCAWFLAVAAAARWVRAVFSYRTAQATSGADVEAVKRIVVAGTLLAGVEKVLAGQRGIKAFFLTSNSFVTELLRLYLIQHEDCQSLCEILHGVPTTDYERYLATLLVRSARNRAGKKHSFVPQIPGLPLYGVFNAHMLRDGRAAINAYLNKYLFEHHNGCEKLVDFIEAECAAMLARHRRTTDALVVCFTGGTGHDRNYLGSKAFRIERFIMRHVKSVLRSMNRAFVVFYTPHPSHPASMFSDCDFFADEGIEVYRDTVMTWLVADICIALMSSALFEAAYFRVATFAPIVPSDGIYPETLLALIDHPMAESDKTFVEGVTRFIGSRAERRRIDLSSRAKARLALLRPLGDAVLWA